MPKNWIILGILGSSWALMGSNSLRAADDAGEPRALPTYACTCHMSQQDKEVAKADFQIQAPAPTDTDSRAWTGCGPKTPSILIIAKDSISLEIFSYQPEIAGKSQMTIDGKLTGSFRILHAGASFVTEVACAVIAN